MRMSLSLPLVLTLFGTLLATAGAANPPPPLPPSTSPGQALPKEIADKVQNVPITTDHGIELYQHWVDQALSSLFSAVANKRLKTLPKNVQNEFGACSKDAKTVPLHARCVSKLLKNEFTGEDYDDYEDERMSNSTKTEIYSTTIAKKIMKEHSNRMRVSQEQLQTKQKRRKSSARLQKFAGTGEASRRSDRPAKKNWVGSFRFDESAANDGSTRLAKLRKFDRPSQIVRRAKRESVFGAEGGANSRRTVVSRNEYTLKTSNGGLTPFGGVAKMLMKSVLNAKNKTHSQSKPWQHVIQGIREIQRRRKEYKKHLEEDSLENMNQFAFRGLKQHGMIGDDLEKAIDDPDLLKQFLTKKKEESAKSTDPSVRLMHLLREGFKIGYALSGKNVSEVDEKSMKIASPRFLSVMPEDEDVRNTTLDFLSPSLFSLHSDGSGLENLTSLPSLINGFSNKDQQEWMNFIIEASDVQEQLNRFEDELTDEKNRSRVTIANREEYDRQSRTKDGTPLYFTKENITHFGDIEVQKVNVFERLEKTYSKEQIRDLSVNGYSLLTRRQLRDIYGPGSPYADAAALRRFQRLGAAGVHAALERDIHGASQLDQFRIRQKDIVLSPVASTWIVLNPALASQPIVLSPLLLSPVVLSPALLGPVILSPWLFVPIIVSPRVLSPLIVSPFVLSPVVLSPLLLHPIILSPGVLDVAVLTPLVLSPVILSPLVFVPLVLSPLVLSPHILSPAVGSPLVLSPFVLSPIILSPQVLSALVLSPYAASPIIGTPLVAYSVVLSPSWLS